MSYTFDGKISNQSIKHSQKIRFKNRPGSLGIKCSCCGDMMDKPKFLLLREDKKTGPYYGVYSYLNTPYYIYESKSGFSTVYCSDKCRRKHNHRFNKQSPNQIAFEYLRKTHASLVQHLNEIHSYIPKLNK